MICDRETSLMSTTSRILEWVEKISDDLNSKSRSCTPPPIPSLLSPQPILTGHDITNMLKETVKGQLVLSFYAKKGFLDGQHQKDLTHCIVDFFLSNKKKMSYSDMSRIAKAIAEKFPSEKEETHFLSRKPGKKNPTGKIFSRWTNLCKPKQLQNEIESTSVLNNISNDEYNAKKCWLVNNCAPWQMVKEYWKATSSYRIEELKEVSSLTEIINAWPHFNDSFGFELIDIDFHTLFPEKENLLFSKLEAFYKDVKKVCATDLKYQASKEIFQKLSHVESISMGKIIRF